MMAFHHATTFQTLLKENTALEFLKRPLHLMVQQQEYAQVEQFLTEAGEFAQMLVNEFDDGTFPCAANAVNYARTHAIAMSPLAIAALNCDEKLIDLLLKFGANINANPKYFDELTPIAMAALKNQFSLVEYLWQKGSTPQDVQGSSALMAAASVGNLDIVKFMVERAGYPVDGTIRGTGSPLTIALRNSHFEIAKYLLNVVDISRPQHSSCISNVVSAGNVEMLLLLFDKGAKAPMFGFHTVVTEAVKLRHFDILKILLEHGATCNAEILVEMFPEHKLIVERVIQDVEYKLKCLETRQKTLFHLAQCNAFTDMCVQTVMFRLPENPKKRKREQGAKDSMPHKKIKQMLRKRLQ